MSSDAYRRSYFHHSNSMSPRVVEAAMPMRGSSSQSLSRRSRYSSITNSRRAISRWASFTTLATVSLAVVDPASAIETLAAGGDHACVITTTGGVKCWGLNSKGQLGYQDDVKRTAPPADFVDLGAERTAVSITAGDAHTCAVLDNGSLKVRTPWMYCTRKSREPRVPSSKSSDHLQSVPH